MERRIARLVVGLAFLGAALGCDSSLDVDPQEYEPIPDIADLELHNVQPQVAYDYWELRFAMEGSPHDVVGSAGSKSKSELDPEVVAKFDSTHVELGFSASCLPAYCYKYIASVRGATIETWASTEELRSFLGTIDAPEEAILLAEAEGYYWIEDRLEAGAIKQVDDGYDLVVLKLVAYCAPIQVDRYLLHIDRAGRMTQKDSELWSESNACI